MSSATLDAYLKASPDRCSGCGFHPERQGCRCADSEWALYVAALRAAVTSDGYVDRGRVREAVRGRIFHKHIGQLAKRARVEGLIADDPTQLEQSTDTAGRNTNKYEPRLRWIGT